MTIILRKLLLNNSETILYQCANLMFQTFGANPVKHLLIFTSEYHG